MTAPASQPVNSPAAPAADVNPDQDPDLLRLKRERANWLRQSKRSPDPYADRSYAREQDAIRQAQARVAQLSAAIASYEKRAKRERQLIGIARRQLGIDDDAHAALVAEITGGRTRTTLGCSADQRQAVLDRYQGAGWKTRRPKRAGPANRPPEDALSRDAMLRKIHALLADQRLPWSYAETILRRQRGLSNTVACPLRMITAEQARGVIAALHKRAKRQASDPGKGAPNAP
jgi:phage gp16-like protein